ncbi:MAG: ribonuclease E/G [Lachnospiraceae bacterium]|nr:ribonuclease E/G [Lachnospiraceae bacterium]
MGEQVVFTNIGNTRGFFAIQDNMLRLADFCTESTMLPGKIYVGCVANTVRNLDASFVEYEKGKQGFLPNPNKHQTQEIVIKNGMVLPVQLKTAPLKTKEAMLSAELSLPGIYCVVTNTPGGIHFSKKIKDVQKKVIKQTLTDVCDKAFSYIIRSNVSALSEGELELLKNELCKLSEEMHQIVLKAKSRTCFSCIHDKSDFVIRSLSKIDFLKTDRIVTDSAEEYDYLKSILPSCVSEVLAFYDEKQKLPLSLLYEIKSRLHSMISKKIWLKSGGYLVVEPTEALTVIDVNSGKNIQKMSKSELVRKTNLEAAEIIPFLLSVNNISGIIVVDFINVTSKKDEEEFMMLLKNRLSLDCNKADVIDVTKLGLVEITRQKKDVLLLSKIKEAELYEIIEN